MRRGRATGRTRLYAAAPLDSSREEGAEDISTNTNPSTNPITTSLLAGGALLPGGKLGPMAWLKRLVTWAAVKKTAVVFSLFLLAGAAEIGGGWMVWKAVREGKPKWWALVGSAILVLYGFVPTLQPVDDFGRLYGKPPPLFFSLFAPPPPSSFPSPPPSFLVFSSSLLALRP